VGPEWRECRVWLLTSPRLHTQGSGGRCSTAAGAVVPANSAYFLKVDLSNVEVVTTLSQVGAPRESTRDAKIGPCWSDCIETYCETASRSDRLRHNQSMSIHGIPRLASITLDCDDPARLAQFWSALLGGKVTYSAEGFATVTTPARLLVTCVRVPDYHQPTWPANATPKQMHLDLAVADLDLAENRAVEIGAVIADYQPGPQRCRVLFDPAGHPFCLCLPRTELTTHNT
jgi:hypothetical protein